MLQRYARVQTFLSLKGVQRYEAYFTLAVADFKDTSCKLPFESKGDLPNSPCRNCDGGVNGFADKVNKAWFPAAHLSSERKKWCRANGQ